MSLGDGSVWDENNPQQSTLVNQGPLYETDFKVGVRSRMALEHNWPSSQAATGSGGQHLFISFQAQTAAPVMPLINATTQAGMLFSSSGGNLLTFQDKTGGQTAIIGPSGGYSTALGGIYIVGTTGQSLSILPPSATTGQALITVGSTSNATWGGPSFVSVTNYGFNLNTGTAATMQMVCGVVTYTNAPAAVVGLPFLNNTSYNVFVTGISSTGTASTTSASVIKNGGSQFTLYGFDNAMPYQWMAIGN